MWSQSICIIWSEYKRSANANIRSSDFLKTRAVSATVKCTLVYEYYRGHCLVPFLRTSSTSTHKKPLLQLRSPLFDGAILRIAYAQFFARTDIAKRVELHPTSSPALFDIWVAV